MSCVLNKVMEDPFIKALIKKGVNELVLQRYIQSQINTSTRDSINTRYAAMATKLPALRGETKQVKIGKNIEKPLKGFKLSIDKKGKDQGKADLANRFIGYGIKGTSTYQYEQDARKQGVPVNYEGIIDENTVAFVSVNGNNKASERAIFDTEEVIKEVLERGGTIIMDSTADANRPWNISGEARVQYTFGSPDGQTSKGYNYWGRNPEQYNTINIYSTDRNGYEKLSNLAYRPFTFAGKKYVSVEHAYQTMKSGKYDNDVYNDLEWNKVKQGKFVKVGGKLGTKTADRWNIDVLMRRLMKASFVQNPDAMKLLTSTNNSKLTHKQADKVWAVEFPKLLEEIREGHKKGLDNYDSEYSKQLEDLAKKYVVNFRVQRDIQLAKDYVMHHGTGKVVELAKYMTGGLVKLPDWERLLNSEGAIKATGKSKQEVEELVKPQMSWVDEVNVLPHETWHAITSDWINRNPKHPLAKKLNELFDYAKSKYGIGNYNPSKAMGTVDGKEVPYWQSNVHEFIAVALAEPLMLTELNKKFRDSETKSLAAELLDTMLAILEKFTGLKINRQSLAGELIELAHEIATEAGKDVQLKGKKAVNKDADNERAPWQPAMPENEQQQAWYKSSKAIMPGINGEAKLNIDIC